MKRFVVLLLLFAPAGLAAEKLRLESSIDAMGTTYTVAVYGEDRDQMQAAVETAFEEVRRLDRVLSNYRADSELAGVNRRAATGPVRVTPELFRLLAACREYSRLSEGTFDITVGPLMKVWGFYKGTGRLPRKAEVAGALAKVGYAGVILDAEAGTVRFAKAGLEIDPGGIGKGYTVDRMAASLKDSGVDSALISAGGSSIYALGAPPDQNGWKVNIRHPSTIHKNLAEVYLRDQSMSTSGNYEKFFMAGGKMYSHIMDPRTGYPASGVVSVSVIAPSTLDSEAWTKPFFILGREWTARHKPQGFRVFLCEDKTEATCAWLQ